LLVSNGKAKILAHSKLATLDNRRATIHIGDTVPIVVTSLVTGIGFGTPSPQLQTIEVGTPPPPPPPPPTPLEFVGQAGQTALQQVFRGHLPGQSARLVTPVRDGRHEIRQALDHAVETLDRLFLQPPLRIRVARARIGNQCDGRRVGGTPLDHLHGVRAGRRPRAEQRVHTSRPGRSGSHARHL